MQEFSAKYEDGDCPPFERWLGIWNCPRSWSCVCVWYGKSFPPAPELKSISRATQILVTWTLKRYNHELQTSEMFSTAGRTVKSGLVASAVVSSWTWAATLLQSSGIAYRYGVSGPFWYASGATVQILLFATIAIELKRRAPNAHVSFEKVALVHSANPLTDFPRGY